MLKEVKILRDNVLVMPRAAFDQITWPDIPETKKLQYVQAKDTIQMLLEIATKVWWVDYECFGSRMRMPRFYKIGDVVIDFLPHMEKFCIGKLECTLPINSEDLKEVIWHIHSLRELGVGI